ncbi:MAG: hypothetical protein KKF56_03985 [Nanoarchaeota archaeon]|nr:hypothetical protein [Nanoarchaeota archaeon]
MKIKDSQLIKRLRSVGGTGARLNKMKIINDKSGSVGSTMVWPFATILIIVMVAVFIVLLGLFLTSDLFGSPDDLSMSKKGVFQVKTGLRITEVQTVNTLELYLSKNLDKLFQWSEIESEDLRREIIGDIKDFFTSVYGESKNKNKVYFLYVDNSNDLYDFSGTETEFANHLAKKFMDSSNELKIIKAKFFVSQDGTLVEYSPPSREFYQFHAIPRSVKFILSNPNDNSKKINVYFAYF